MIGAIIGDIVGSRFEFNNHRSKDFELFTDECFVTDDSIMTIAVAKALMESKEDYSDLGEKAVKCMQELGRPYPDCGYGGSFYHWIYSDNPKPYNSFGNGAAMRVSPVGWVAKTPLQAVILARKVTEISHNHPEGIKGAVATAMAIYMAQNGKSKEEIREYIGREFYEINFTLDEIRETYQFNETCQDTVPQALQAFYESTSFEDAIRNAISIGGDSDTLAAITGGVAEAYWGIPNSLINKAKKYLDLRLLEILVNFIRIKCVN